MLAPQSGADINGQMGMIQDVITKNVSAIILSTHDEAAAAPLVKQAVEKGIAVIIVNSDIADFPTPVHGVVGYSQRAGTTQDRRVFPRKAERRGRPRSASSKASPAIIRPSGSAASSTRSRASRASRSRPPFRAAGMSKAATPPRMDLLQANPDVDTLFAANDYMIMGAALAAKSLGRDRSSCSATTATRPGLEQIADGT